MSLSDAAGNLYIADHGTTVAGSRRRHGHPVGHSMTAGDIYTVAGQLVGVLGHSGDGGAATSAFLDGPTGSP